MLSELDRASAPGSSAVVVVNVGFVAEVDIVVPELSTLGVEVHASREPRKYVGILDTRTFDNVVVFGYRQNMEPARADGWTLLTLLWLNETLASHAERPRIIVELLDAKHVELARLSGADDYVISDALLSRLMAQLADQPKRRAILQALFDTAGPSLTIEPAATLGLAGRLTFAELAEASYQQGFLAVGVRQERESVEHVILNPPRSELVELGPEDAVIAIR